MTQPFDHEGSARPPALVSHASEAGTELTQEQTAFTPIPHYSVALVLSTTINDDDSLERGTANYDVPVISITYQSGPYMKPVEVGHVYIRTDKTDPRNYQDRQLITRLTQSTIASIHEQLNGASQPQKQIALEPLFTHRHTDRLYTNVTTLFVGPAPSVEQSLGEAGYFAYAQVYTPHKSVIAAQPLLAGYDPFIALRAVSQVATRLSQHQPHLDNDYGDFHDYERADSIAISGGRQHLVSQKAMEAFDAPHTYALGNFAPSRTGQLMAFPDRKLVDKEKRRRGIGQKTNPAAPTTSQLG